MSDPLLPLPFNVYGCPLRNSGAMREQNVWIYRQKLNAWGQQEAQKRGLLEVEKHG